MTLPTSQTTNEILPCYNEQKNLPKLKGKRKGKSKKKPSRVDHSFLVVALHFEVVQKLDLQMD